MKKNVDNFISSCKIKVINMIYKNTIHYPLGFNFFFENQVNISIYKIYVINTL